MEIADRNGVAFFLVLCCADCLSDLAIFKGDLDLNISCSKSKASLWLVTAADHFLTIFPFFLDFEE